MSRSESGSPRGPFFVLEVTSRCNNHCLYCYNVWTGDADYPTAELDTESWKRIIRRIRDQSPSELISLTGGEPLLRDDLPELVQFSREAGFQVNLITNGTLLTPERVAQLVEAGVTLFELPLLARDPAIHDQLAGNRAWRAVIDAINSIKKLRATVVGVMVVTRDNLPQVEPILELGVMLGIDGIMLNRFNPGGRGIKLMERLLPSAEELGQALETADQISVRYGLPITSNIPIQPCLINPARFPNVRSGFCSTGTEMAYYAVDSSGNMRPCNHSPTILGNLLSDSIDEMIAGPLLRDFMEAIPPICEPCPSARTCQGGCKASAQVCFGSPREEEPFLKFNLASNPMLLEQKQKMLSSGGIYPDADR